jgi:hypothetical protein
MAPLPRRPTTAPPGSPARIAVYRRRAERGELLYHPRDASDCKAGETRGGADYLSPRDANDKHVFPEPIIKE